MGNPSNVDAATGTATAVEDQAVDKKFPAHLFNRDDISAPWRYGVLVWLTATLALLLASDLGSGVKALTETVPDASLGLDFQSDVQVLLEASVFTSVKELWNAGSQALSIFVAITSIAWPYIKILLTFYAWCMPIVNAKRRYRLIVALDVLGKWSFADVVVFAVIVVVFRETIPIGAGYLEVWIRPQWGLYGFISASMLSLMATHAVLFHHRLVMYGRQEVPSAMTTADPPQPPVPSVSSQLSNGTKIAWMLLLLVSFVAYLVGAMLDFFNVTDTQGGIERGSEDYSLARIGRDLPDSKRDYESAGGLIYLQIVWFLLGLVMPLLLVLVLAILSCKSFSVRALRHWLFVGEIALSWSCSEVFLVSTVLAIREIPTFGEGLIDTGCNQCYAVTTEFKAQVAVLILGTVIKYFSAALILPVAHRLAYDDKTTSLEDGTSNRAQSEEEQEGAG